MVGGPKRRHILSSWPKPLQAAQPILTPALPMGCLLDSGAHFYRHTRVSSEETVISRVESISTAEV